jgi:hypothetical protein
MLTQLFPFLDPAHITPDLARRLHALADDCDRLERSGTVPPLLLRSAPLLKDWMLAMTPKGLRLIGNASGHPVHGDRRVMTTHLWFADPDGHWIRTLSLLYRLGPPPDAKDIRRALASTSNFRAAKDDTPEDEV